MAILTSLVSVAAAPFGYEIVKKRPNVKRATEIPSVVFVTLPKSATMFLRKAMEINFGLQKFDISPGYFPVDNIDLRAMLEFKTGGYATGTHLNASGFNLDLLGHYCDKWVVNFRDPRAALLSFVHHFDRPNIYENPAMAFRIFPRTPDGYRQLGFEQKVDWHIENYLPGVVDWIEGWLSVIDRPEFGSRIILTQYEDIVGRDEDFILGVINELGLPAPATVGLPPKDMKSHYRNGSKDAWMTAFTPKQIEVATRMIPRPLMERFGWSTP